MSCEICGRSSCTRSFHSFEAQDEFDSIADNVKNSTRAKIIDAVNRVDGRHSEDDDGNEIYVIDLQKAIDAIERVDL